MSTFSNLNTALTGLNAQRRAMDITGKNIANANSEGYSRQRVELRALGGTTVPAIFSTSNGDGGGVEAGHVARLRDTLLEVRARTAHDRRETLTTQQGVYAALEQAFGEPSDTGLQAQLGEFWNSWHDVANNPGDMAARTQLLQRASTTADSVNQASGALQTMWSNRREQLGALVDEVNTGVKGVAELNQAVQRAEIAGLPSAELADQRDVLVVRLAELTGATGRPAANGMVDVYLNGSALVRGTTHEAMQVSGSQTMAGVSANPVTVSWAGSSVAVGISSGSVGATMDAVNTALPGYSAKLDGVAASLVATVNAQHATGYDLSGSPGGAFFTGTTAATVATALTRPADVAASATAGGNLDGTNANRIAVLSQLTGGPDQAYRRLVVDLGVEAQNVNRRLDIQKLVTTQVDAARDSTAGVDLDEEMTSLIAFQHAYSGAARLMTAVDETMDTLINHTGLVGR
jgi:flagellar hook-associated protein 1 FlgK